jgi:hypothetical protein
MSWLARLQRAKLSETAREHARFDLWESEGGSSPATAYERYRTDAATPSRVSCDESRTNPLRKYLEEFDPDHDGEETAAARGDRGDGRWMRVPR